ncbi:MAG: nitronate monooxygenase [Gammaproteobacteria bacterium]|jgi:nitronate monooxygenase
MNNIQKLFNIDLPIIQAPMAGVQGSALTAAVSNAGGLGSLPCGMLSLEALEKELSVLQSSTNKPYNVNFFCHSMPKENSDRELAWRSELGDYFHELGLDSESIQVAAPRLPFDHNAADVLEKFQPPVVSFHFGLPSKELLSRVKNWGAAVISTATTVDEARFLETHGADAIIAQGIEAGGHRGNFLSTDMTRQLGLFSLLPQVIEAVNVPVIAAGGIANAVGVNSALLLGAAGVQIGTAYLLCPEAKTSAIHRAALASESACHTAITNLFTGRPARGVVNRVIREKGPMNSSAPAFPNAATAMSALRGKAESLGLNDFSPMWCGQNSGGCLNIPAAELTHLLASVDNKSHS